MKFKGFQVYCVAARKREIIGGLNCHFQPSPPVCNTKIKEVGAEREGLWKQSWFTDICSYT